jgi:periplasmic nitrate reductase NapE
MSRNAKTVARPAAHDQSKRSQLTTTMHFQPTKKEELRSFLFLTVVMAPVLTGVIIAGYGFLVWIYQIIAGPPTGG